MIASCCRCYEKLPLKMSVISEMTLCNLQGDLLQSKGAWIGTHPLTVAQSRTVYQLHIVRVIQMWQTVCTSTYQVPVDKRLTNDEIVSLLIRPSLCVCVWSTIPATLQRVKSSDFRSITRRSRWVPSRLKSIAVSQETMPMWNGQTFTGVLKAQPRHDYKQKRDV